MAKSNRPTLSAFGINCTLTPSDKASSTQKLLDQLLEAIEQYDVATLFSFARLERQSGSRPR